MTKAVASPATLTFSINLAAAASEPFNLANLSSSESLSMKASSIVVVSSVATAPSTTPNVKAFCRLENLLALDIKPAAPNPGTPNWVMKEAISPAVLSGASIILLSKNVCRSLVKSVSAK